MKGKHGTLNNLFVEVYNNVINVEEKFVRNSHKFQLSIREMHMIEYIGANGIQGHNISEIANYLGVAKPSVTVAVNKLEKKGYLSRINCEKDGRVVHVCLTPKGKIIEKYHQMYHSILATELEKQFTEEEMSVLGRAVEKINSYFKESVGKS